MSTKVLGMFILLFGRPNTIDGATYGDSAPDDLVGGWETNLGFYQGIELTKNSLLYETESEFQDIEVHQSKFYGKVLLLDGSLQLTERDADSYNEMMAHIPMFQHSNPKRILIIGGGDGYVLSEVLKHSSVEKVDHVDLDDFVVATCEKFFPQWASGWKDPRVTLHVEDGVKFIKSIDAGSYDVVIQDSSDPFDVGKDGTIYPLPSGTLYEESHFCALHRILSEDGVLIMQAESYNVPTNLRGISEWRARMTNCGFERTRYGSVSTSSYSTGQIGFLLAERQPSKASTAEAIQERYNGMVETGKATSYYHPPLQNSCFDLPLWVHNSVYTPMHSKDGVKDEL